jgi:CYTH domain-containing protein
MMSPPAREVIRMDQHPIEVERKWLVQALPDLSGYEGKDVIKGYIAIDADGTEVRLRQTDGTFFETVKSEGELVRDEIEVEQAGHGEALGERSYDIC